MRHDRSFADLKRPQFFFKSPISEGYSLMLPKVLNPVLGNERLNMPHGVGRIGEMLPEQRTIATTGLA
jgi:hypothetical protein